MDDQGPYSLLAALDSVKDKGRPPVHLWHPDDTKDIDMVIQQDGTWMYMGTPIKRQRLVHLFASVLRREGDEYFLVTPVEKCRITIEDAPFQAVLVDAAGQGKDLQLTFTTDMAEQVVAGPDAPIRAVIDAATDEPSVYVMIRDGLEARLNRPAWYQLAEHAVEQDAWLGVWSGGEFFKIQRVTG